MTKPVFVVLSLLILFAVMLTLVSLFLPQKSGTPVKINAPGLMKAKIAQPITLIIAGDVMLGRTVMGESAKSADDLYPFRKIADYLKNADLTFVNLENPIVTSCPLTSSGFKFCSTPKLAAGLTYAGVDVVTLANNHAGNYGAQGLTETLSHLGFLGISATDEDSLIIKDVDGTKFGFLGFNFTFGVPEGVVEAVRQADKEADILVVGVHWGKEYTSFHSKTQSEWAKKMVEAGADVIAGSHPHWVQDSEYLNGKPVYYSLGNLVFDQMWSEETKKGLVIKLTFESGNLVSEERAETYMYNLAQPEVVNIINKKLGM